MKKPALIVLLLLLLALGCACGGEEPSADPDPPADPAPAADEVFITFRNEVETADIWLLPQTEENRHSSLWGTATLSELATGAESQVSLTALGGPGTYILLAIDVEEMYYEASDVELAAGYTLRLSESDDPWTVTLDVTDASGAQVASYSVFAARL